MATAKNAKLMKESGQTLFDYTAATDSGDQTVFTVSGKSIFSDKAGYTLSVRPDGVLTGRNMLSPHADAEKVTVAAFTLYLAGVETSISATTATAVRPASGKANINSICIDSDGAIEVVTGTDSLTTALVETRDAVGGPPLIPVGSVEIGQVRLLSSTSAVITADEIFQTPGTHSERFDSPTWSVNNIGDGSGADTSAQVNAYIKFDAVIGEAIHTGGTYKKVHVRGYVPILSEIAKSVDFVPCQNSHSVTSTQVYNGTIGSSSSTLGQGGFKAMLSDGITDALVADEDETLVFKFFPDRNKSAYSLIQGLLGIKTTFPVADQIQCDATISADTKTANFSS